MKRKFSATVMLEGEWYVAQCLEIDIASQGQSEKEALKNLTEALELHLEGPMATLIPQVQTIEIDISAA